MSWTPEEAAAFAACKRHELCRRLGRGNDMKGLHRLLLAERRVERLLDREGPPRPRPARGDAAAAPTRPAAATGAGMTKETAQRRRRPASAARKARSSARLQEFLAAKEGERHHLRSVLQRWRRQHTDLAEVHGECEPLLAHQGKGAKRACAEVSPSEPSGDSRSYAAAVRNGSSTLSEAANRGPLPPAPEPGGNTPPPPSASALTKRQMLTHSPPPDRSHELRMGAALNAVPIPTSLSPPEPETALARPEAPRSNGRQAV